MGPNVSLRGSVAHGPEYEQNVMFLCRDNSCASQMAEGFLRDMREERSIGVASAGIEGAGALASGAVAAMKEVGVDISRYSSDAMTESVAGVFF